MDAELLESIRDYLVVNPEVRMLESDESDRLRMLVANRFGLAEDGVWWWEGLPKESVSVPYSDQEGLDLLLKVLPATTERLSLFVTDDNPPPWACVSGVGTVLVGMLREQRFFEYFIVDSGLKWIVFDTHHNTLVILGRDVPSLAPSTR